MSCQCDIVDIKLKVADKHCRYSPCDSLASRPFLLLCSRSLTKTITLPFFFPRWHRPLQQQPIRTSQIMTSPLYCYFQDSDNECDVLSPVFVGFYNNTMICETNKMSESWRGSLLKVLQLTPQILSSFKFTNFQYSLLVSTCVIIIFFPSVKHKKRLARMNVIIHFRCMEKICSDN